jgi:hypothetical protein
MKAYYSTIFAQSADQAFVEWRVTFDCPGDRHDHWAAFFETSFAKRLGSLRMQPSSERFQ